jgi:hypothetical protein
MATINHLDVLQPVVVDLLKAIWHDAHAAVSHRSQRRPCKGLHAHKPLVADEGFDDLTRSLRSWGPASRERDKGGK